ncbi:MAG: ATP-binding protein [Planctomycetales bacterium]|nr:ATP-binding protein [Planctomycetales bacterium]
MTEPKSLQEQLDEYMANRPEWTAEQLQRASDLHDRLQEKYRFQGNAGGTVPEEYRKKLMEVPEYHDLDEATRKQIFWNVARTMNPGYTVNESQYHLYRNVISDVFNEKGILLIGNVGTGKSMMMQILQKAIQAEGKRMRICSVPEIEQQLRTAKEPDYAHWDAGVVCFDDLGTENESVIYGNRVMVMTEILYRRYNRYQTMGITTHITTNLLPEQIEQKYGSRVWDRLQEMMNIYVMTGKSHRRP